MRSHNKKSLLKFPKYWLRIIRYSIFKSSSFMFCQSLIKTLCAGSCLYFLTGNSIQIVYNGRFSNANNDFNVTILETKS